MLTCGQITISMLVSKTLLKAYTETTKSKLILFETLVQELALTMLRQTFATLRGQRCKNPKILPFSEPA